MDECLNNVYRWGLCHGHVHLSQVGYPRISTRKCDQCQLDFCRIGTTKCRGCSEITFILQTIFLFQFVTDYADLLQKMRNIFDIFPGMILYLGVTQHPIRRALDHVKGRQLDKWRFLFFVLGKFSNSRKAGEAEKKLIKFCQNCPNVHLGTLQNREEGGRHRISENEIYTYMWLTDTPIEKKLAKKLLKFDIETIKGRSNPDHFQYLTKNLKLQQTDEVIGHVDVLKAMNFKMKNDLTAALPPVTKPYICKECSMNFPTYAILRTHIYQQVSRACPAMACNKVYRSNCLEAHLRENHKISVNTLDHYECGD